MIRLLRRRPAIATVPTIDEGKPPEPALQREVLKNQNRTAEMWSDTERDIVVANIVNEGEEIRDTWRQIAVLAVLALVLLLAGIVYTNRNTQHDRLLAQERAAGAEMPYAPQAVSPNR